MYQRQAGQSKEQDLMKDGRVKESWARARIKVKHSPLDAVELKDIATQYSKSAGLLQTV